MDTVNYIPALKGGATENTGRTDDIEKTIQNNKGIRFFVFERVAPHFIVAPPFRAGNAMSQYNTLFRALAH